jgi:hypothetical protein
LRLKILFLAIALQFTVCAAPGAEIKAWVLQQDTAFGPVQVHLSDNAFRADAVAKGFRITCKAPDWKVVISRESEKTEVVRSLKAWGADGLVWSKWGSLVRQDVSKVKRQSVTYQGLAATKLISDKLEKSPGFGSASGKYRAPDNIYKSEVICTDKIVVSKNVTNFMQGIYNLSMCLNVPLSYVVVMDDGRHTMFYTQSIKQETVQPKFFDYPVG